MASQTPRVIGTWRVAPKHHSLRRRLRATLRDTMVLVREFRVRLALLALLMGLSAATFWLLYDPGNNPALCPSPPCQHMSPTKALYAAFSLMTLDPYLPFPDNTWLAGLYCVLPIAGVALMGEGLVSFSMLLFSKRARKEEWQMALASTYRDHVIVCGLGKVGYRVTRQLLDFGEEVVGIEQDDNRPFVDILRQLDVPVLVADARQRQVLMQAGIEHASAVVACTQDDLSNLDIALDARELNPNVKVVMRMFDAELAKKIERGFGIHTAFSTSALAAPAFAAAATRANVSYSFHIDDMLLNLSQVSVPPDSPLVGKTLAQVEQELDLTIVQYKSATRMDLHPDPNIVIEGHDCIAVFAQLETLGKLNTLCQSSSAVRSRHTHTRQVAQPPWWRRLIPRRPGR